MINKKINRMKRKLRVKHNVFGTDKRLRLSVYRSNRYIYGQVINDEKGTTIMAISSRVVDKTADAAKGKNTQVAKAELVGKALAQNLLKKKITNLVFDRNGYRYHGQVRALAEGLRAGGITV